MNTRYHLIGIGGIGMSGIAQLLLRKGFKVSGSDLKTSRITDELKNLGANIFIGHRAENIQGADVIVYSSAIKQDNPEILEALKLKLPILKRAQALSQLMQEKTVITVTGSHGKTTTSSLIACLLLEAGMQPGLAVGGILKNIDTNSYLGNGEFFVAEADESDGSFLYYRPKYSIVTNIDREHLDYYKELENELDAFSEFLNRTEKDGCVFCCDDDYNLKTILKDFKNRLVLFGLQDSADIYPKNIKFRGLASEFECFFKGSSIGRFELALGGRHNISNALSVIALGLEIGIDVKFIKQALKNYKGSGRRLEIKFSDSNYLLIDDYAHHPTEIMATLEALKYLNRGRVIVIFQPHRYTRTKLLQEEFGKSFDMADYVILTDIYAASETPIPGVNSECIYKKIKQHTPDKKIVLLPKEKIAEHILSIIKPDDLVATLGAGDIVQVSESLAESLNAAKYGR